MSAVVDHRRQSRFSDPGRYEHLLDRYRSDEALHPGPAVRQVSPYGDPPVEVRIEGRGARG